MHADLELALSAARGAGEILARHFRTDLAVEYKSARQPVTAADLEADRYLRKELLDARPDYGWLSEESDAVTPGDTPRWVIDPLDGTWNFIEGRPEFAVCVGLVARGTPMLGVVYNPMSGTMYHASRGAGAYRDGERILSRSYPDGRPILVASVEEMRRGELAAALGECEPTTLGSTALKIARVADGGADLYLSTRPKGLWDVCAGWVVATEAGAVVTTLAGEPIDFSNFTTPVPGLIVAGRGGREQAIRLAALTKETT